MSEQRVYTPDPLGKCEHCGRDQMGHWRTADGGWLCVLSETVTVAETRIISDAARASGQRGESA